MLKTNLSTRPFYNERPVHTVLVVGALLVAGLTVFNATRIVALSRRHTDLNVRAEEAETRAREMRTSAVKIRAGLDPKALEAISVAAREANAIIDRRLFSWTDLFNRFETTLPNDVRIVSVRPRVDADRTVTIQLTVIGRRVEDIDAFMDNLEATGAFADVLSREETLTDDRLLLAVLEGRYAPVPTTGVSQEGR